jgi:hypothetical protein
MAWERKLGMEGKAKNGKMERAAWRPFPEGEEPMRVLDHTSVRELPARRYDVRLIKVSTLALVSTQPGNCSPCR